MKVVLTLKIQVIQVNIITDLFVIFRCEADLNDSSEGLRLFRENNHYSTTEISDNNDENSNDFGRNHAFEASDDQDSAADDEDVSFQPYLYVF